MKHLKAAVYARELVKAHTSPGRTQVQKRPETTFSLHYGLDVKVQNMPC